MKLRLISEDEFDDLDDKDTFGSNESGVWRPNDLTLSIDGKEYYNCSVVVCYNVDSDSGRIYNPIIEQFVIGDKRVSAAHNWFLDFQHGNWWSRSDGEWTSTSPWLESPSFDSIIKQILYAWHNDKDNITEYEEYFVVSDDDDEYSEDDERWPIDEGIIAEDEFGDLDDKDIFGSGGHSIESGERRYDDITLMVGSKSFTNCSALVSYAVDISGRYVRATQYEPAEHPDLVITNPVVQRFIINTGEYDVKYLLRWKAGGIPYYIKNMYDKHGLIHDFELDDGQLKSILDQILEYWSDEEDEIFEFENQLMFDSINNYYSDYRR